jgi:excisionase family DNA binding protein
MPDQPDLMTVPEAAAYLRVGSQTIYRLVRRKALPGDRVGGQWRIRRVDLEAYIRGKGQPQIWVPRKRPAEQ